LQFGGAFYDIESFGLNFESLKLACLIFEGVQGGDSHGFSHLIVYFFYAPPKPSLLDASTFSDSYSGSVGREI